MTRQQGIALENRVHSKRVRLFSFHRNRKQQILFLAKKKQKIFIDLAIKKNIQFCFLIFFFFDLKMVSNKPATRTNLIFTEPNEMTLMMRRWMLLESIIIGCYFFKTYSAMCLIYCFVVFFNTFFFCFCIYIYSASILSKRLYK